MTPERILVGLALENVPVAAMARATGIPSDDVWPVLRRARERGEISALPPADWRPGQKGVATAAPARLQDIPALRPDLQRCFGLTPQQATALAALLVRRELSFEALAAVTFARNPDVCPKALHVVLSQLRAKLRAFPGITIETVRSGGYALPVTARDAIQAQVAAFRAREDLA